VPVAPYSEPTRAEQEQQIKRLLGSKTFEKAQGPRSLLAYIADRHFEGKTVSEPELAQNVLGMKEWVQGKLSVVRTQMGRLRRRLTDYYIKYGGDDLVVVTVPGYQIAFSYARESEAARQYRVGMLYLAKGLPVHAHERFLKATQWTPDYAIAYAGLANADLLLCILRGEGGGEQRLAYAEKAANKAVELNSETWEAHVALGAIFSFRREWEKAWAAFNTALQINEPGTQGNGWYLMFILAGMVPEATINLTEARAKASPEDSLAQAMWGLSLYMVGIKPISLGRVSESIARILMGFEIRFFPGPIFADANSRSYAPSPPESLRIMSMLHGPMRCFYAALQVLSVEPHDKSDPIRLLVLACVRLALHDFRGADQVLVQLGEIWLHFPLFDGLRIYCIGSIAADPNFTKESRKKAKAEAQKLYGEEFASSKNAALPLALAQIGIGREADAVRTLERAYKAHDPMTILIHRLPLLFPLLRFKSFQKLSQSALLSS